jgi:hypothetical protein
MSTTVDPASTASTAARCIAHSITLLLTCGWHAIISAYLAFISEPRSLCRLNRVDDRL